MDQAGCFGFFRMRNEKGPPLLVGPTVVHICSRPIMTEVNRAHIISGNDTRRVHRRKSIFCWHALVTLSLWRGKMENQEVSRVCIFCWSRIQKSNKLCVFKILTRQPTLERYVLRRSTVLFDFAILLSLFATQLPLDSQRCRQEKRYL